MEIIYPPLVEESINFHLKERSKEISEKADMYRLMVERGIILENGEPTPEAIEKGWVKDFYEAEDLSLEDFLALYPVFNRYDLADFQLIDGFWEIPVELKQTLLKELEAGKFDYDDSQQITEYLTDR